MDILSLTDHLKAIRVVQVCVGDKLGTLIIGMAVRRVEGIDYTKSD